MDDVHIAQNGNEYYRYKRSINSYILKTQFITQVDGPVRSGGE